MGTRSKGQDGGAAGHDHGYKKLFSHARAVEELLRGFLEEDWAAGLDFSTLEKAGTGFVSDDLRERHSDVIWRLRWKGSPSTGSTSTCWWNSNPLQTAIWQCGSWSTSGCFSRS